MNKNILCEYCNLFHDGSYGSGRFCNSKCAHGFTTREKRQEINKKVSDKLMGRPKWGGYDFKKGHDPRRHIFTDAQREVAMLKLKEKRQKNYSKYSWEELPIPEKRRRILIDQENKCLKCGVENWCGEIIILELDHINGDHSDNRRENLRILCPNCHSLTPTYRNKKRNTT